MKFKWNIEILNEFRPYWYLSPQIIPELCNFFLARMENSPSKLRNCTQTLPLLVHALPCLFVLYFVDVGTLLLNNMQRHAQLRWVPKPYGQYELTGGVVWDESEADFRIMVPHKESLAGLFSGAKWTNARRNFTQIQILGSFWVWL